MKIIIQSLTLVLSFLIVAVWQHTQLSEYTVPALGALVFFYFIISAKKKNFTITSLGGDGPMGVFILNTIIFLLIFSTGGIYSNLYFLLYFLAFGIAFVFRSSVVFVFAILSFAIFTEQIFSDDIFGNLIKVGSLLLISPLAYFFGREFNKEEEQERKLRDNQKKAKIIEEEARDVAKRETSMNPKSMQELKDVAIKAQELEKE